jgi:peptidoglycan/xylan/chitin deacetylase (PgdA/CDA1 family)
MSEVLVLCYHAVSPSWTAELSVTPDAFAAQMRKLVDRGWRGATFHEAVHSPPARRTLAVTFDDAFLSVLERAYPILAELGLPATVFVPTAFADRRQRLRWDGINRWSQSPDAHELECMTWDDLRVLVEAGWEIGSHTRTHPRLTRLSDDQLSAELETSREDCSTHLGAACVSLAYPYGDVDRRVAERARQIGYACGAGLSSSLAPLGALRWPRVGVYHGDSPQRFALKISSFTRWARATRWWPDHE